MLNSDTKQVLEILRRLTGEDGNFKIIEADEVLEKLPADMQLDKVKLSAIIRDLRDREYLKVKYFTPDEYCLLTLKRVEEIQHIVEEVASSSAPVSSQGNGGSSKEKPAVKRSMVLLFAFIGGLLGGAIVTAIAIVLQIYAV